MNKYQNKYRIPSARLQHWNYGWNAAYFVTICTHNRQNFFGKIAFGKMVLSEIGEITRQEWLKTFEMRPDMNLTMGEFVVMPNHFHAIIIIGENEYNTQRIDDRDGNRYRDRYRRDAMHCVSTYINNDINTTQNKFGPQSKNLASIVRGFKSAVTKRARSINPMFAWQRNYYEHIIRDDESYIKISKYIKNNPQNWNKDDHYDN
ncbi:MAG TPA: transposase [Ignavibacteria bacterium]